MNTCQTCRFFDFSERDTDGKGCCENGAVHALFMTDGPFDFNVPPTFGCAYHEPKQQPEKVKKEPEGTPRTNNPSAMSAASPPRTGQSIRSSAPIRPCVMCDGLQSGYRGTAVTPIPVRFPGEQP
jgi:hypothetical protein